MNASTTSTRLRGVIATAILGALASSFSSLCSAADVTVKYGDLNVGTAQGATALYGRLREAAQAVCSQLDHGDVLSRIHAKACVRHAIADAVSKVNEPALFTVYDAKNSTPLPAHLVSQSR